MHSLPLPSVDSSDDFLEVISTPLCRIFSSQLFQKIPALLSAEPIFGVSRLESETFVGRISELLVPIVIDFGPEQVRAKVLIDTGSRAELLIKTSLIPISCQRTAKHPIGVRTADG